MVLSPQDIISFIPTVILALFLFGYLVWSFFVVYHLIRFGVGPEPKRLAFLFLTGSAVLLGAVAVTYTQIDLSVFIY